MSIVVEDGTGLANSNSYVDVAGLRDFAALRGVTLPVADSDCEILLIKAMDYIELKNFIGKKNSDEQALSWPRKCAVTSQGLEFATDEIPENLKRAECQLAIEAMTKELQPSGAKGEKGPVMSESVYGAVSRTYAQPSSATAAAPYLPFVTALLRPLLLNNGVIYAIRA